VNDYAVIARIEYHNSREYDAGNTVLVKRMDAILIVGVGISSFANKVNNVFIKENIV